MKYKNKKPWLKNMDLTLQGEMLVERKDLSKKAKEWITLENKEFFFKAENPAEGITSTLAELIYYYAAKSLGLQALEVKPAWSYHYDSLTANANEVGGVISQNFITDKTKQTFVDFYKIPVGFSNDVGSNVEYVDAFIKTYTDQNIQVKCDTKKIKNQLEKLCILDYFFVTQDRHKGNMGLIATQKDGYVEIVFAPIYDNAMILFLSSDYFMEEMVESFNKKQYRNIYKIVDTYYSSSYFMETHNYRNWDANLKIDISRRILEDQNLANFYKKIQKINLKEIAIQIENEFPGYKVPMEKIQVAQCILNYQQKKIKKTLDYIKAREYKEKV